MRIGRLVTVLATGAAAVLPLAVVSPVSAEDYQATTETVVKLARTDVDYRDTLRFTGGVMATIEATGEQGTVNGEVTLLRRWRGTTAWKKVATTTTTLDADGAYLFSFTQKATRNAAYRVRYAGGTETSPDGADTLTFAPSTSDPKTVWVQRGMTTKAIEPRPHHHYLVGTVKPYAGKVVALQRKTCKSCHYKVYAKVRTNAKGRFRFPVDFPRTRSASWFYRVKVPGNKQFATTFSKVYRAYVY